MFGANAKFSYFDIILTVYFLGKQKISEGEENKDEGVWSGVLPMWCSQLGFKV